MAEQQQLPIPEPPRAIPFLGHVTAVSAEHPVQDLVRLAETHGDIYRLRIGSRSGVFVCSWELVNQVCDEKKFQKTIDSALKEVRYAVNDGLFTAFNEEEIWGVAHRILVPAFGPLTIRGMFPDMHEIASQLALKWARHGSTTPIHVTEDFTRLTLDTIALCAMGFRFNSYYRDGMHPFVAAMARFLVTCDRRDSRPGFLNAMHPSEKRRFREDVELMRRTADEVLRARRQEEGGGEDRKDLLNAMLKGVDPRTGKKLSDSSVTDNLITFLIAGHETTSGLLSFAFLQLIQNPSAYRRAQQEVDDVVGRGPITVEHMSKMPYLAAILRETLRVNATIPALAVEAKEDTVLRSKGRAYAIPKGQVVLPLLARSHLDPQAYGPDAAEFRPERMLDDEFARLQNEFPNSWKPFGNGMRGCIGRPFAWQESILAMALLLQSFNFVLDDPNYRLRVQEGLTIKPKGFYMRAIPRHGMSPAQLERQLKGTPVAAAAENDSMANGVNGFAKEGTSRKGRRPMSIFYGSNSGTCEAMARRLALDAPAHGFYANTVDSLDAANGKVPRDQPVVVVTASYEGQPPDNAAHFVAWIESLKGKELEGVEYAVFGCGHRDWVQTYHRIPKLIDTTLEHLGGTRLVPMGSTDAAERDMFTDFETWEDKILWPAIRAKHGTPFAGETPALALGLDVEVTHPRTTSLHQEVREAVVTETRVLSKEGASSLKKHIEIMLPPDMPYSAGDYLAVLPSNPASSVARVLRRFGLASDACLTISGEAAGHLPADQPVPASSILSSYVELAQLATKRNILAMMKATEDESTKACLENLAGDEYTRQVTQKRLSPLDILEQHPSISLPLSSFLGMLPPMRIRQYSISSSPLANPTHATLTWSVLDTPSLSNQTHRHVGVASTYLASLGPGDRLHVSVRRQSNHATFHLPRTPETTPIICVASGSGIAPFRGFAQERARMVEARGGREDLAPMLLFFGCRAPGVDDLHAEELERWEAMGAVRVRWAYSRAEEKSFGCRYVQERVLREGDEVLELWERGARVYVCGSRKVAKGVDEVWVKLAMVSKERAGEGMTEEEARRYVEGLRNERIAIDVFD